MPLSTRCLSRCSPALAPASSGEDTASRAIVTRAPCVGHVRAASATWLLLWDVNSSQGSGCAHVDGSSVRVQWRAWKPQGPPAGGRRGVQSAAQGQCRPRHFLVTLDLMYFNGVSSGPSDFLIITPSRQSKRSKVNCPFLLRFALNYYYYYF